MTRDERKRLLKLVGRGLDIESGAAQLGLPMAYVKKAGKQYASQLETAFAVGNSLLRARVIETAVVEDDTKTISAELERRELTEAAEACATGSRLPALNATATAKASAVPWIAAPVAYPSQIQISPFGLPMGW